jgi:hypothetical protein
VESLALRYGRLTLQTLRLQPRRPARSADVTLDGQSISAALSHRDDMAVLILPEALTFHAGQTLKVFLS